MGQVVQFTVNNVYQKSISLGPFLCTKSTQAKLGTKMYKKKFENIEMKGFVHIYDAKEEVKDIVIVLF